jgi:hypothetical protein
MRASHLCVAVLVLLVTAGLAGAGTDGTAANATAGAPVTLAQGDSSSTTAPAASRPLGCCFGGATSDACTLTSPNRTGCEFVMAYNCGKAGYRCDDEKGICRCNAAGQAQSSP